MADEWLEELPGTRKSKGDLHTVILKCKRNPDKWLLWQKDVQPSRVARVRRAAKAIEPDMEVVSRTVDGVLNIYMCFRED